MAARRRFDGVGPHWVAWRGLRLVLLNCRVPGPSGGLAPAHVTIDGGVVVSVSAEAAPQRPGELRYDARERILVAASTDAHLHPHRLLAAGRERRDGPPLDDLALAAAVRLSLIEAALAGVSTVVAHASARGAGEEALERAAIWAKAIGVRLVIGLATSDEDGPESARLIEASAAFARAHAQDPWCRGQLALQASGRCGDPLLAQAGRHAGLPLSIPVAEDEGDLAETHARTGLRPLPRLAREGLLGPATLLAHATFLDRAQAELAAGRGAMVVLCPREGLASGRPPPPAAMLRERGLPLALGTDGFAPDVRGEGLLVGPALRAPGSDAEQDGFALAAVLGDGQASISSRLFGGPAAAVRPGATADLALLEHREPAPVPPAALGRWYAGPLASAKVACTIVGGRLVVRDGALLGDEPAAAAEEAMAQARRLCT